MPKQFWLQFTSFSSELAPWHTSTDVHASLFFSSLCASAGLAENLDKAALDIATVDQLLCWLRTTLVSAAASDTDLQPLVHKVATAGNAESHCQQSMPALASFSRVAFAQPAVAPQGELQSDFMAVWLPDSPYAEVMDLYPAKHSLLWPLSEVVWQLYMFGARSGAKLTDAALSSVWGAQAQSGKDAVVYTVSECMLQ